MGKQGLTVPSDLWHYALDPSTESRAPNCKNGCTKLYIDGIQPWWLGVLIHQFSHSVEERFRHTVDRIPLGSMALAVNIVNLLYGPATHRCVFYV